jgi:hypothetical protein
MKLSILFTKGLHDNLKTFRIFELILAAVCILLPLFLYWSDTFWSDNDLPHKFRSSVSAYYDIPHGYMFGMLLCIPAMLFMFNGAVYFRRELGKLYSKKGKWYNMGLGACMLIVILFNYCDFYWAHSIFAAIFFAGNAFVIAFIHPKGDNILLRYTLAFLAIGAAAIGYFYKCILIGEWISLVAIGVHFILVTIGMINLTLINTDLAQKI